MKIESTLVIQGQEYSICGQIHNRRSQNKYQLDIKEFYEHWGKKIPKGNGYEIEILNDDEIQSWHQKQKKLLSEKGTLDSLHVHHGNDQKPYVCYPLQIKTKDEAIRLFKEWVRVMFIQIFFGLSDSFLYESTKSGDTTAWANFIDSFLNKKGLKIEDSIF